MKPSAIAIIGMSGRFPGARSVSELWKNVRDGVELIKDRSDAELLAAGATFEELSNPDYVKRAAILDDVPLFDASFFGFSPRDASIMDPQHRHFLECAWEALEDAGHPPRAFDGSIGVFAGSGINSYLIYNLLANRKLVESAGLFQLKQTGNDKDVLATRVSYQLDLRGPSVNIQTACSTSLVAAHLACQSLLNFECDMALAGGVTIEIPHGLGYIYRQGEILSRDGHCRAFDAASSGTVFGSGLGLVVLRRLEDALHDGDQIHAVVLGSAINNDGARKVGYLAPSVEGQTDVIAEALEFAGVTADDISYVETHGTGTLVGDPIEIRALTNAFRKSSTRSNYCGIGSLKTNIGHLDAAAGIAGLIKTVLALKHGQRPPSLHFKDINPHIPLSDSPFFVNQRLNDWPSNGRPRRAGVTSLGIGGTNAHLILEEAPSSSTSRNSRPCELLISSAKTESAANVGFANLISHVAEHSHLNLADIAFTSQVGRQAFAHRRALVVKNTPESVAELGNANIKPSASSVAPAASPDIAFMFTGQGSQYVNMGRELYAIEPVFREVLDSCATKLQSHLEIDLLKMLFPPDEEKNAAGTRLNETWLTQPALFSIEYALARWWMSLGVQPAAMVGHSIGEYVAACISGVISVDDALAIVAFRGRSIFDLPAGAMLSVPLSADQIELSGSLSVAAINNPSMCVISGPIAEIDALEQVLTKKSIACRRLHTSHAFHSSMMDPMLNSFEQRMRAVHLSPPRIPYLSNVTGTWIKAEEATDPAYWARHIRQTVRFSDNLAELFRKPEQILIENGPGNVLVSLARMQGGASAKAFQSLPHPNESNSDLRCLLSTVGQLWTRGVAVDFARLHAPGTVKRVSLPTYPFERQKYWIAPDRTSQAHEPAPSAALAGESTDTWYYRRSWEAAPLAQVSSGSETCYIVFRDEFGLGDSIGNKLKSTKNIAIFVDAGSSFGQAGKNSYTIRPGVRDDYDALLGRIIENGLNPQRILHLWSVVGESANNNIDLTVERSFFSPLYLSQALGARDITGVNIVFVTNLLQKIENEKVFCPARGCVLGPARVTPLELPGINCRVVDLDFEKSGSSDCADQIIAESNASGDERLFAYREGKRFVEALERIDITSAPKRVRLRERGSYLITGGLGGLGLAVAKSLATQFHARLVLVSRSSIPPDSQWNQILRDPNLSAESKQLVSELIEIRSAAGGLLVLQADVSNLEEMRAVVAKAKESFGSIDGVFQAAGVLDDGPLLLKTKESAARVLKPKVQGTLVLEEVLRDLPLSFFVLFSSISSIDPPAGQVDYAAANAFLDTFAASGGDNVTAINWDAWREIGMAARTRSPHPLLGERLHESPQQIVFSGNLSVEKYWVLGEHRLKTGNALLPGTGYMEMAAEALSGKSSSGALEFEDVFFLAPLSVATSTTRELRIQLNRSNNSSSQTGAFNFSILARDADWTEHATGRISSISAPHPPPVDTAAISMRCCLREIRFDEQHRTRQEQYFDFGTRWHSLHRICLGDSEGIAELSLSDQFAPEVSTFHMHPALLDMATGCSLYLIEQYEQSKDLYLPFAYKRLILYRDLPARILSHIRVRHEDEGSHGEIETFDITILTEKNEVVAEIEGFAMRRISAAMTDADKNSATITSTSASKTQLIEIDRIPGLLPQHGVHALTQILAFEAPHSVVVSSHPVKKVVPPSATAAKTAAGPKGGQDVEATLTDWFKELLGAETVGPDDDFFSLGGHSLIGVRLFAKIKNTYGTDLAISTLFEASTVRLLAKIILKAQHPTSSATLEKNWQCLVPIQPNGSQVPFFFIHPLGGEVLTYEPLAKAFGPDQPFYAFRSILASQNEIRETTIEELATTYVQEIRAFLPRGPYYIGGHSYGGIIAFEMAHQLYKQGVEPSLVIMLDAIVPGSEKKLSIPRQLENLLKNIRTEGFKYLPQKIGLKFLYWRRNLHRHIQLLASGASRFSKQPSSPNLRYMLMEKEHSRTLERYRFRRYPGRIQVIRATERRSLLAIERGYHGIASIKEIEDPTLGWESLTEAGVEVHEVHGHHLSILSEPYVKVIAEELKAIAAAVRQETNA